MATWGDGTALSSYRVTASELPDWMTVRDALHASFSTALAAPAVPDVLLAFDDAGSPWHTRCTATGRDRPGLLHALTTAFATAGVNVHAARIGTDGTQVVDHFDLTDRRGAKLDEPTKARVARTCCARVSSLRRGRLTRRERRAARESRGSPAVDGSGSLATE